MSSGFTSNYNDSGYTLPAGTWYDTNNNVVSIVSSRDIYTTTELAGVYLIDGTYNAEVNVYYPIFCSYTNYVNVGVPGTDDDAWLVYPGYGFTLYTGTNYSGIISKTYVNTSNVPVIYYNFTSGGGGGGWIGYGTPILRNNSNLNYPQNATQSAKIYFRGTEILVNGIS
jgi:hypothetical protein